MQGAYTAVLYRMELVSALVLKQLVQAFIWWSFFFGPLLDVAIAVFALVSYNNTIWGVEPMHISLAKYGMLLIEIFYTSPAKYRYR